MYEFFELSTSEFQRLVTRLAQKYHISFSRPADVTITAQSETTMACNNCTQDDCNCAGIRGCGCNQNCDCRTLVEVWYLILISYTFMLANDVLRTVKMIPAMRMNRSEQILPKVLDREYQWVGRLCRLSIECVYALVRSRCPKTCNMPMSRWFIHYYFFCFSYVRSAIGHGSFLKNSICTWGNGEMKWNRCHHATLEWSVWLPISLNVDRTGGGAKQAKHVLNRENIDEAPIVPHVWLQGGGFTSWSLCRTGKFDPAK